MSAASGSCDRRNGRKLRTPSHPFNPLEFTRLIRPDSSALRVLSTAQVSFLLCHEWKKRGPPTDACFPCEVIPIRGFSGAWSVQLKVGNARRPGMDMGGKGAHLSGAENRGCGGDSPANATLRCRRVPCKMPAGGRTLDVRLSCCNFPVRRRRTRDPHRRIPRSRTAFPRLGRLR